MQDALGIGFLSLGSAPGGRFVLPRTSILLMLLHPESTVPQA